MTSDGNVSHQGPEEQKGVELHEFMQRGFGKIDPENEIVCLADSVNISGDRPVFPARGYSLGRSRIASVWRPSGPVPETDPPIAGPILDGMVLLLRARLAVILIADDRRSRDRAVALLKAALDDGRPPVLS